MDGKKVKGHIIPPKIQLKNNDIAAKEDSYAVKGSFTNSVGGAGSDKLKSIVQDTLKQRRSEFFDLGEFKMSFDYWQLVSIS